MMGTMQTITTTDLTQHTREILDQALAWKFHSGCCGREDLDKKAQAG